MTMVPAHIVKKLDAIIDRMPMLEAQVQAKQAAKAAQDQAEAMRKARDDLAKTTAAVTSFRERADSILSLHGGAISPPPVLGEATNDYMRRVLAQIVRRLPPSHPLTSVDVSQLRNDDAGPVLTAFTEQIMNAAVKHSMDPATVPRNTIVGRTTVDPRSGLHETTFVGGLDARGNETSFIKEMSRPGRKVHRIVAADSRTGVRTVLLGPRESTL